MNSLYKTHERQGQHKRSEQHQGVSLLEPVLVCWIHSQFSLMNLYFLSFSVFTFPYCLRTWNNELGSHWLRVALDTLSLYDPSLPSKHWKESQGSLLSTQRRHKGWDCTAWEMSYMGYTCVSAHFWWLQINMYFSDHVPYVSNIRLCMFIFNISKGISNIDKKQNQILFVHD